MLRPLAAMVLVLLTVSTAARQHDCLIGTPLCNNSLASDKSCRGVYSSDINAWHRKDCDYVVYDVKAPKPSNKYIVIHAGGCDSYTETLGDYAYRTTGFNLFGLRPCASPSSTCINSQRGVCDALHISWNYPVQPPYARVGFNPPALIQYATNPANQLLFLHEYDGLPDYPWAKRCDKTHPSYVCVHSLDGDDVFKRKFYGTAGSPGIKPLLEQMTRSKYMPCAVEVIDARNSSKVPGSVVAIGPKLVAANTFANLPCSGMYSTLPIMGWEWEFQGVVMDGMALALRKHYQGDKSAYTDVLEPFTKAIQVAMGP